MIFEVRRVFGMASNTQRVTVDLYVHPERYSESGQLTLDMLLPPGSIGIIYTLGSSRSPSYSMLVKVQELRHAEKPWQPVVDVYREGWVADPPIQYEHSVDIDMIELDGLSAGQVISFVYDGNTLSRS
jgi:hypothetical protein